MECFSWGANSYGQLGQNHKEDICYPTCVNIPTNIHPVKIYGGGGHTVFSTSTKKLYSCGCNGTGQLGLGHKDHVAELQEVESFHGKDVKKVACGWDFTLILTADGSLHCCGCNDFGQLGLPLEKKHLLSLEESSQPCLKKVGDISAGLRHSIVLTDGTVFTFGNGKRGQLGQDNTKTQPVPTKVELPPSHGKVVQVVAGAYHSAVLTEKSEIFFWGCNKHGQGSYTAGDPAKYSTPVAVKNGCFDGKKITSLHSGWTHFLALAEDGTVYSWGRADYGQLGRDVAERCDPTPKAIPGLVVKELCCGSENNLAILESGQVVSWGWNEHGICGDGDDKNIPRPKVIDALKDYDVVTIGCGGGHSFALGKKKS